MTRVARKSFAKKFIFGVIVALLAAAFAVQLIVTPTVAVAPIGGGNTVNSGSNSMNGVSVTYRESDTSLAPDDYRLSAAPETNTSSSDGAVPTPAADDEVNVIVTLSGTPMMRYASDNGMTVSEAIQTAEGKGNLNTLKNIRDHAKTALSAYIIDYNFDYGTVINAFSAKVKYGDVAKIENDPNVESVIISNTFDAPKTVTENYVDVYSTGIFNSDGVGYDGTGVVVAVVDTGTDYTHEVFDMELDPDTVAITKDDVAAVAPLLTATSQSAAEGDDIDEDDLYIKTKLPFAYDYADSDTNVYPHNSHGTHVAGIIAGKSDVITGVAPGAQIATFKVFSDYRDGADTEWILAGLNDAVTLGVDVINMSLGTSCGFSREVDETRINEIYDAINDAGICLVVAASNDASSAQASTWGNTNLATNPDSGTVGSPASYPASLAVASVSGVKTKYFTVGDKEIYFAESRLLGKTDTNDFVQGMLGDKDEGEFEYVVIPGIGQDINYSGFDVEGKIAVVRRGSNSFEDKVKIAASHGAIGVIVYNNLSGTISMSVGTKEVIPSCFVTMDLAEHIIAHETGTVKLSKDFLAGPFMSDFSSWGCLPDLQLAPDITGHGGEIYSAVAGGNEYDIYSGTSMAAPNMSGALVLVSQYVKENNPGFDANDVRDESYNRMMSTATIVRNEEGNPYSPRKQGAGIANIVNSINTKAYLTVDGSNKPKLSLGDDPDRTGVYEMSFNLVNKGGSALSYSFSPYVMTESMSSDGITVAEKAYMFNDTVNTYSVTATRGKANIIGNTVNISGYGEAVITVKIALSDADKKYIDEYFRNGMFVEGYIRLLSNNLDGISLGIPFLAFYGDWTDAPMLDKSAYEVGESLADGSVLATEKLQADSYGTLPYSGFYSSSASDGVGYYGMGAFAYIPATGYIAPPALEQYAAVTTNPDGDYLFYMVSAGLLRGAKRVDMSIRNSATGELLWSGTDYNARKTHSSGGSQTGGAVMVELNITELNLPNNSKYTFEMECFLDWKDENGEYTYGNNNKFSFEFTVDNEKPTMRDVAVRRSVDESGNVSYTLELTAHDNHFLQGFSVYTYEGLTTDNNGNEQFVNATPLTNGLVPVVTEEHLTDPETGRELVSNASINNSDTLVSYNITSYWSAIQANGGKLYVSLYDYAKNTSAFELVVKEETDIQIEKTRKNEADPNVAINGQTDLLSHITVKANTADSGTPTYVEGYWTNDLVWESSDTSIAVVSDKGIVIGRKAGDVKIRVRTSADIPFDIEDTTHCLEFNVKVTERELSEVFVASIEMSTTALSLERGETATITAKILPEITTEKASLSWSTTSSYVEIVSVSEDTLTATVRALRSGSARVRATLNVEDADKDSGNGRISGFTTVRVLEEFRVEHNIYLRSYTGRGDENGVVEIPQDLGVAYIYPSAFAGNEYIKKVIIPEGVTTIMRAAFASCTALEEVVIPESLTEIDELAFLYDSALTTVTGLGNVHTIGDSSFWGCSSLNSLDLSGCTYIDNYAFAFCTSLTELDLSKVGIIGGGAFTQCTGLTKLVIPANTSMEYDTTYLDLRNQNIGGAFTGCTGLTDLTVYADSIGDDAFFGCSGLRTVTFMNDVNSIGEYAFAGCSSLTNVVFNGSAYKIDDFAFAQCESLSSFRLPDGLTILGNYVWYRDSDLTSMTIASGANLDGLDAGAFYTTSIRQFIVENGNKYLSSDEDGVLYDRAQKKLIAFPWYKYVEGGNYKVADTVKTVGASAFSYAYFLRNVDLNNVEYVEDHAFDSSYIQTYTADNVKYYGAYAFANSDITALPLTDNVTYIGDYAFMNCYMLTDTVFNAPKNIEYIGAYAFAGGYDNNNTLKALPFTEVSFAGSSINRVGEYAFANCNKLTTVNLGNLTSVSAGMFRGCSALKSVTLRRNISSVGAEAFMDCSALAEVNLTQSLVESIPARAFAGTAVKSFTLTPNIRSIGAEAFANTPLASINLENVYSIGNGSFASTSLVSVKSDNVTTVGNDAFKDSAALTSVELPKAEYIGGGAFAGDTTLSSVELPAAKYIGASAFENCSSLETIGLASAEEIGDGAFTNATALETVELPKVRRIGNTIIAGTAVKNISLPATLERVTEGAFFGAEKLSAITVDNANKTFKAEDGVLYIVNDENFYTLVCYPAGKTDKTAFVINDRTIKLGARSFSANKTLKSVTLSPYIEVIGIAAMTGMTSLEEVNINAVAAPLLESEAFIVYDTTSRPNAAGRHEVSDYYNVYDNFNFENGSAPSGNFVINIPSNGRGYDGAVWNEYVGKYVKRTTSIHVSDNTLEYIESIKNLPAVPTADDRAQIEALVRRYNQFDTVQRRFITGNYTYTDGDNSIDSEYYGKLLGGTNYYTVLTNKNQQLGGSTSAAEAESAKAIANTEYHTVWSVVAVLGAALALIFTVVTTSVVVCERRSEK